MIVTLILAAGQAKRMGRPKQLLPWGDTTILGRTLQTVKGSNADAYLVVTGAYREEVEAVALAAGISTVHNPDFAEGEMLSSLQVGIRHLRESGRPVSGVLVMLGDLPFIGSAIMNQILDRFREGRAGLTAPYFGERRGHPVCIGAELFDAVLALPLGSAPRALFKRFPDDLMRVQVDSDVILLDIDTPEQYERLKPADHS